MTISWAYLIQLKAEQLREWETDVKKVVLRGGGAKNTPRFKSVAPLSIHITSIIIINTNVTLYRQSETK